MADKLRHAVEKVNVVNKCALAASCSSGGALEDDSPTIKVCVRVRPFIKEEIEGDRCGGRIECCIAMPTTTTVEMLGREDARRFEFDRCYWSHSEDHPLYANQQMLQDELGVSMLTSAMNGFNNCIFAYGQTGSGKSFSVLGGKGDARGLLPRVVEGLFEHFAQLDESVQWKTEVSFIEIYNEQIRDLFAVREDGQKEAKLEVKQHAVLGTVIPGLTEAPVNSCEEVMKLVEYGTTMRHVAETAMNATSSRSHCIFTFKTSVSETEGQAKMSCTHLVDLAGSERAGRTKASGARLKEGAAINQSLSVLANVIRELAKQGMKKKSNPPFRGSKLTYILKESLCGNSKTVMMAAISPALADYDETLSTMNFAKSVKQVQTKAVINQVNEKGIEDALRAELEELRGKLAAMEQNPGPGKGMPMDPVAAQQHRAQSSVIEKRLKEQEQLCRWFGKNWEEIVAEEKSRQQKRAAILHHDSALEAFRQQQGPSASDPDEDATTRSDATGPEDVTDSDEDSATDQERRLNEPLLYLRKPEDSGGPRASLRLGTPSFISVVGPRAASCKATEQELDERSSELRRVRESARKAEEVVAQLSAQTLPRLLVRAVISIEPAEVGEPMLVEVVAHSYHVSEENSKHTALGLCRIEKGEWMTEETLMKRLQWLERAEQEGGFDQADPTHGGDAWKAAILATSLAPELGASPQPSSSELEEGADAVTKRSCAKEVNRLNEELLIAQEEISRMKSKLKKEKEAVKDLREELGDTQEELAKVKEKAKRQTQRELQQGPSDEAAQLRAELQTVREQLARRESQAEDEAAQLRAELQAAEEQIARREAQAEEEAVQVREALELAREQLTRRGGKAEEEAALMQVELEAAREELARRGGQAEEEAVRLRAELEAAREKLARQGGQAEEEVARLRAELEAARKELSRRDQEKREPPRQVSTEAPEQEGVKISALGQVPLEAGGIAKALAFTFDNAINAIDMVQSELERLGAPPP